MEELAGRASLRDAGTTAGIATDKLLALPGETGGGVPVQVNFQVNAQALHQRYRELVEARERRAKAQRTKRPCQTAGRFRILPPQWICRAETKTCKNSHVCRILAKDGRALADVFGYWQISADLF